MGIKIIDESKVRLPVRQIEVIIAENYNHLNLPTKFIKGIKSIEKQYVSNRLSNEMSIETAQGRKLKKILSNGTTKSYIGNVEYVGSTVEAIYHAEGRARNNAGTYVYEYVIKDHLGDTRMAFTNTSGTIALIQENHYYPFGMQQGGWTAEPSPTNAYKYNGKELNVDFGLNLSDYGARWYDAGVGRFTSVDPMAEKMPGWSGYSYSFNNPIRHSDPDGMAPEDIVLRGKNNSSLTVKTDAIDINLNVSSLGIDFEGNHSIGGSDVVHAALDVAGVADPSGIADGANAALYASEGKKGDAAISALGVLPLLGDIAKVGRIGKSVEKIGEAVRAVNGNSKISEKAQHVYEIFETGTGNVVKTGVSSGKVSAADKSYRATNQVNTWNKAEGVGKYDSRIIDNIPSGPGARQKALNSESENARKLIQDGHLQDPSKHQVPRS